MSLISNPSLPRFLWITLALPRLVLADPASDYSALTRNVRGIPMGGTAGGVAVIGRMAFPVAVSGEQRVTVAAGRHGDNAAGGAIVCFGHTSLSDPKAAERAVFLKNVIHWAGGGNAARLACGPGINPGPWKKVVSQSASIATPITRDKLPDADVLLVSLHDNNLPASMEALHQFAASGKGVLFTGTPWAAKKEVVEAVNGFLESAGLAFHGEYSSDKSFPVSANPPSPYWSALNAIEVLKHEHTGKTKLDPKTRQIATRAVEEGLAVRPGSLGLADEVAALNREVGWIQPTKARPLVKERRPVEAMLAQYQANLLDTLPADQVPAHPAAADWPGPVPAGSPTIIRELTTRASAPSDKFINSGRRGIRRNTGVYAVPGRVLTITIPDRAKEAGLVAQIGVHVDKTFHLKKWNRFPKIAREWPLRETTTQVACAFGGLVIIGVPPGCVLGDIKIRIEGGVQAPAFVLGRTTEAEWNADLKNAPGAWGYIESRDFCSYLPRSVLAKVSDPERVARYWQSVMETADKHLGYGDWRKRGEGGYTDRDISAGYGHAGYPVVMAYGDRDALAKGGPDQGDWGFLHEIGHTFQDSFDGNYTIATHAEVDVNLVPGIVKMLIHDVTCIDNRAHSTFDAKPRLAAVKLFQAAPPAEQTWDRACKSPAAYDFYFTLAECFGWELYGRAFGRLMSFLKYPEGEPQLMALDQKSPNNKRDRFFLLFCQESGHNLLPHFQKYGLGRGNFGLSPEVIAQVAHLPEWRGNRALNLAEKPAVISLPTDLKPGALIHQFKASDPDPGTVFTWTLENGNSASAFTLDKRSGQLTVKDPAATRSVRTLTIKVSDSTVPESTDTLTVKFQ
jgi:hypothetical protein